MKLLVFAHTPPPHHGQSYMVKLMLDGFGGDWRRKRVAKGKRKGNFRPVFSENDRGAGESEIQCYHVNARFSEDLEDIGAFRPAKVLLVLRYCMEAIWCRFRYGIHAFYYVPAPGKRAALYRDWIVMLLCRPFFRHFIHHWHAVGLGDWLQREGSWIERWITHRLLARPSLGIALAVPGMRDALWFRSRKVEIVANGIPDPCPDFAERILPRRRARTLARSRISNDETLSREEEKAVGGDPQIFHVLYLAHCTAEKGLFDSLDAVRLTNQRLRAGENRLQLKLTVAGKFLSAEEEKEFRARLAEPEIARAVDYKGFVSGREKYELLSNSDCLCFPTYYPAEGQPVNLIEAMAFGLVIVTTRWRAIPEILPPDYSGFTSPRQIPALADALLAVLFLDASSLRDRFLKLFNETGYLRRLTEALEAGYPPANS